MNGNAIRAYRRNKMAAKVPFKGAQFVSPTVEFTQEEFFFPFETSQMFSVWVSDPH